MNYDEKNGLWANVEEAENVRGSLRKNFSPQGSETFSPNSSGNGPSSKR